MSVQMPLQGIRKEHSASRSSHETGKSISIIPVLKCMHINVKKCKCLPDSHMNARQEILFTLQNMRDISTRSCIKYRLI